MQTSSKESSGIQATPQDVCCCKKIDPMPEKEAKCSRFEGRRLHHAWKYQPFTICLPRIQAHNKKEKPCGCPEDYVTGVLSKQDSQHQRHLQRCKEEKERKAEKEYHESVKDSCLTQEQRNKQYKTEPSHAQMHPQMQQLPKDCSCRLGLSQEEKECMEVEDCKAKLCRSPCVVEQPATNLPKLHCTLPDLCKVHKRRRDEGIKEGRWDDMPVCQWDYWDKTSPYWQQEKISQVPFINLIFKFRF